MCDQVRLEILYSARSAGDYDALSKELLALRQIPTTATTFGRALEVQQKLAHVRGLHHRSVKIADLLIAAAAEAADAVVWHYDADYDRIATVTGQPTEWIATQGSLLKDRYSRIALIIERRSLSGRQTWWLSAPRQRSSSPRAAGMAVPGPAAMPPFPQEGVTTK